jgi:predicted permease
VIRTIGVIVTRRLRADWKQEWEAELQYRELLLENWDKLDLFHRFDLLRRSLGAFWDALCLQPSRLEDEMLQDFKYGVRMILKNPGFTGVVLLTLALGIGANAALFSVVNSVLLNPLPFPEPEQLITLHQSKPNFETGAIPYPNFLDWKKENQTFAAMAISRGTGFSLIGAGETERVTGRWVTDQFFSVHGIKPVIGRDFTIGEDERGAEPVVLISARLWQRKFGGSQEVLYETMTLDDKTYSIIGVLPSTFTLYGNTDVFVPIGQWGTPSLKNRSAALGIHGIGRLKPGVTLAQAQADMDRVMRDLAAAYPLNNRDNGAALIPLRQRLVGNVGVILWLLLGAVGFVLLIACVNVSNLLLARSTSRTREFAIRSALGASQWRLVRQLLTESLVLSVAGGALGLALASLGTKTALKLLPSSLPRSEEISVDYRVIFFTLGVTLLTGLLSGLAPSLKSSHWGLSEKLKEGALAAGGGRNRSQSVLVAAEVALALVLLIGAGLMIRSLSALWKVDPGFRSDGVLTFGLSFPPSMRTANEEAARATVRQLSDTIASSPGVRAASFTAGAAPLQGEDDLFFWLEGEPKPATTSEMHMSLVYRVEPGYLSVMGIPLKQGRFFDERDKEGSPAVAVVDEVFARKYFPNSDPIGKGINLGDERGPLRVIGVVGHVKQWSIDSDERRSLQAQLYEPLRQLSGPFSGVGVVVRAEQDNEKAVGALFDPLRRVVQNQNSQNVIFEPQTLNEVISDSLADYRFPMILLNSFAAVALLMASVGLYGVISYLVGQRTHELGVRLALGAQRRDILRLVINQGMKMALSGVAVGTLAALGLTRLLTQMLFSVSTTDPLTFAVITSLLALVALLACFLPALRATRVDPLSALRHE